MHSAKIPFKLSLMYNVQFTMPELKLGWKQIECHCWDCDLNAINIHKSLKLITYSRLVVDNPFSQVTPPTSVIDTFVWSIPRTLDLKFKKLCHRLNLKILDVLCMFLFVGLK